MLEKIEVQEKVKKITAIICDRCGKKILMNCYDFQETISVIHACGYDSIFGDDVVIRGDFCQHCIKELLGQYLRVTDE